MIEVTITSNAGRNTVILPADTTVYNALSQNGVDTTYALTTVNGSRPLTHDDLDLPLSNWAVNDRVSISSIVKANNA